MQQEGNKYCTNYAVNLFFPFTDITCFFFLKFKTSVLSNNRFAKLFKETSYSKATMVMRLPAKTIAQKHSAISCQEKMAFPTPHQVVLGLPSPPQSLYGWTYTDVTTKISRINSLPNLLSNGAPL